jgi:hypothetical protein
MTEEGSSTNVEGEFVSLSKIMELARRLLPISSTARAVILAERDALPASEALAKLEIFDRLLSSELGSV